MSPKKSHFIQPSEIQSDLRQAEALLNGGNYEELAKLLADAQLADEALDNQLAADILATVREICEACSQSRAEVKWHQLALERAQHREEELRSRLSHLLSLTGGGEAPSMPDGNNPEPDDGSDDGAAPNHPTSSTSTSLWKLVQNLLKRKSETALIPVKEKVAELEFSLSSAQTNESGPEQGTGSADLAIYCLGPFRVYRHGQLLANWSSHKSQDVFKFLVKNFGNATSKDKLMDLFWPEADPEAARRNLHQAIYSLRQTLRRGQADFHPIQFENDCYSINPALKIWIDHLEFDQRLLAGRRFEKTGHTSEAMAEYRQAEKLYRGDFLEENLYEDWISLPREKYRNAYLDLADRLSEYLQQEGFHPDAIEICQKILVIDNCYEKAHARLMKSYQAQGEKLRALRQYQICAETLQRELEASPSTEIRRLFEQINGRAVTSA